MPFIDERYDLSGRVALAASAPSGDLAYVAGQMNPFRAAPDTGAAADIALRAHGHGGLPTLQELHRPAGDGLVTGSDGEDLYLIADGRACRVPDPLADGAAIFAYEQGFPLAAVFSPFVRTALQLASLKMDAVAVHAATAEVDGGAVLVAGWSESGKTETALALMERGGRFLSDKWTLLGADTRASAFPIDVGIRRWVLPYLPRLRSALPARARLQLGLAAVAAGATAPLGRRAPTSRGPQAAFGLLTRAVALAERTPLSPSQLRAAYGQDDDPARTVPVRAVAVLKTIPSGEPRAESADAGRLARRLALSAAYERRPWFGLVERARFAAPERTRHDLPAEVIEREQAQLAAALDRTLTLEVSSPFPADPHSIAAAIEKLL